MELEITSEKENPLLDRREIEFEVDHAGAPTPSRSKVSDDLSSELGVSEEVIVIEKMATPHGHQVASGIARVYESKDRLEELESEYLSERTEISKEKVEETGEEIEEEETEEVEVEKETEKEIEEKEAEKEETEEEAEEVPEEEIEEEAEEAEEEPELEEKVDYQDISENTIADIKDSVREMDLDLQKLLETERENKDRKTLKKWIDSRIESSEGD